MLTAESKWADLMADDVQGWFNHPDALLDVVARVRPRRVVELGTWKGASAIPIARLISTWGGRLYCVDTWDGSAEHNGMDTSTLFQDCAANLNRYGLHNVTLHRETSQGAAVDWPFPVNMVYVDAAHDEHSVAMDLMGWWGHVLPGGVIAGDDYGNPDFPGVTKAWNWFIKDSRFGEAVYEHGANNPGLVFMYKPVRGRNGS